MAKSTHFRVITPEIPAPQLLTVEETAGMESESTEVKTQTVTSETQAVADMEETAPRPHGKTDSPSKRKGEGLLLFACKKKETPLMK